MSAGVLFVAACNGEPLTAEDMAPEASYVDMAAGEVAMRRLTQAQFRNSILDLFGSDIVVPEIAEPDVLAGGLLAVGASEATYSSRGVESWESASYSIAEQVMDTQERRDTLVTCTPQGAVDSACAEQVFTALGRLTWRRPLTDEEVSRLVAVADTASLALDDFYQGLE